MLRSVFTRRRPVVSARAAMHRRTTRLMAIDQLEPRLVLTAGINDPPQGTDATYSFNEDTSFTFAAASFGFTDPVDAAEFDAVNTLAAVILTELPSVGSLTLNGTAVTLGQRVPVASFTTGTGLTYVPVTNALGSPYATLRFHVQDNGGTVFGGIDTDPTPATITFNVLPVNDPPDIAPVAGPTYVCPTATTAVAAGKLQASDVDGATTFTYGVVSPLVDNGTIVSKVGTYGTLYVRKATGDFEFHPNSAAINAILASTSETFQFTVSDGTATTTTNFVVSLTAANRAPELVRRSGTVTTAVTASDDYISAIAMQADGKIVAAGYSNGAGDLGIVRYNANGTLDTSFGGGDGIATNMSFASIAGMRIQPDGKIVVVGENDTSVFAMARFNADGTTDTSFGSNGLQTYGSTAGRAQDVAIQSDGKLVVVGYDINGTDRDFFVLRLNSNGSFDASFNGSGVQQVAISSNDYARAVAIQADGKIVVAGHSGATVDVSLVRLNTDGSLDTSFDGDGKAIANYNGTTSIIDNVDNVLIAPDGKILITTPTGLMRFSTNGSLDTSFGSSGLIVNAVAAYASSAIDGNGRIVIAGNNSLSRYSAAGVADATFGTDGSIATSTTTSTSTTQYGQRVLVQPDGRIVVGGYGTGTGGNDFRLQRFNANGTTDITFGDATGALGGTAAHTEGGNPTPIDLDVGVSDPELSALNAGLGNFDGTSLTIARTGNANAADLFGIALGQTVPRGPSATFSSSGTNQLLVGGKSFGSFSQTGGTLTISFAGNGSGTTAIPTTALVNDVLQRITYQTTSATPPASTQLTWTFSDGNTGSQGGGGALTTTGASTVTITATNSAPLAIAFINATTILADDASTSTATKLADIRVEDDGMGTNTVSLVPGFDAASFEIVGTSLYLKAGVQLRSETKASYTVRVQATDASIPFSTITADFNLTIARANPANNAPTAVSLSRAEFSVPESLRPTVVVPLASISVIDDALGTNTLTLTGPDAPMFETTEGQLYLRPGIDFDYGVKSRYTVIVSARDASLIGSTPVSATFTLLITNDPVYHGREYLEPTSGETVTDTTTRSGVVQLIKRGAGTTILTAASTHGGGTTVEAGEVVVRDPGALGSGRLTVKSGTTVQFDVHSGNVGMGGLTVEPGGRIEIGYGRFTVSQGGYSLPAVRQLLLGGFLNGWVGVGGLGTRSAGSVQGGNVGYIVNDDGSITVGFAANGDTNLDGTIDLLDLSNFIASGKFDKGTASGWVGGDFNHDGIVDILDATGLISTGLVDAGPYIPAASPAASPSATAAGSLSTLSPTEAAFLALVANDASAASTPVKKVRFAKL